MNPISTLDSHAFIAGQAGESAVLIDIRSDTETARGKIPGALHIPLHLLPIRLAELDKNTPLVFCCQMGGRSVQACQYALAQGYTTVYNLQGGVNEWIAAGKQT